METAVPLQTAPEEPTPSPFIPGTYIQYAWDSTSLGWLKTCPRLYQYSQIEGWRSKSESVHLRFGIEYHQTLQDYQILRLEGLSHNDALSGTIRDLLERTREWKPDHKYKNREILVRTAIWYLDKYENDPASTYILSDGRPAVEVSFRFELDYGPMTDLPVVVGGTDGIESAERQPYIICGHLDRIVNFGGDTYVMDHKTTSTTPGDWYWNT